MNGHTRGDWTWWTSNSWRRLRSDFGHGTTVDVLMPCVLRDGQPDIIVSDADMALIAAAKVMFAALLPFAELADEGNHDQPDETKVTVHAGRSTCYGLTLADLRRVRAVIAKASGAA